MLSVKKTARTSFSPDGCRFPMIRAVIATLAHQILNLMKFTVVMGEGIEPPRAWLLPRLSTTEL